MRKILISLLLAGAAATPAIGQPMDWSNHQQPRADRAQAREERPQARETARAEAPAERPSFNAPARMEMRQQGVGGGVADRAVERPTFNAPARMEMREQAIAAGDGQRLGARPDRGNFAGNFAGRVEGSAYVAPGPRMVRPDRADFAGRPERGAGAYAAPGPRMVSPDSRFGQLQQEREQRLEDRGLRQSTRPLPNVMRSPHPLIVSDTPRPGTQPPLRAEPRRTPAVQWNTNWRNNHRYDWRDWRRHHRSIFHIGFYYDPFGWDYFPYQIGWRMWPTYYGSNFWINDPWMYRLPYAPPGYVWIRYWNDALLVDTWTGTVVDMIPGFFW